MESTTMGTETKTTQTIMTTGVTTGARPPADPADYGKGPARYDTLHDDPAPTTLHLAEPDQRTLARQAAAGYPHEVCGLLVGRLDGDHVRVERLVSARNLNQERAHDRYILDPQAFVTADAEARRDGLEILGIWHSHPDSPARPSLTDLEAAWEGYSYVIVTVRQGQPEDLRSYRLDGPRFREERVAPGLC